MTILFCGDVHGRFDRVIKAVLEHEPAAVVLLGDLDPQRPLEQELATILWRTDVWFIHGNHETDHEHTTHNLLDCGLADRNLHGRVVDVAGVRIAGLGGVFRQKIWWPPNEPIHESYAAFVTAQRAIQPKWLRDDSIQSGQLRKHRSSIYPDVFERLAMLSADILVTHEAPSCHPHGHAAIDELAQYLGVQKAFHGHHHDRLDYAKAAPRLGFQAFGIGLRGISDQDGRVVVAGELDEARMHRHPGVRGC